jgi:hypothetical protein
VVVASGILPIPLSVLGVVFQHIRLLPLGGGSDIPFILAEHSAFLRSPLDVVALVIPLAGEAFLFCFLSRWSRHLGGGIV